VLWGTDWPHPNMTTHAPDDGALVDMIPKIAPTAAQQQALLVETPRMVFPFARAILADVTRDGGFTPVVLQPIDFGMLWRMRQTGGASGTA